MSILGDLAYNAYCDAAGNRSLVSGDPLPLWDDLPWEIRQAWDAAAEAVATSTKAVYESDEPWESSTVDSRRKEWDPDIEDPKGGL